MLYRANDQEAGLLLELLDKETAVRLPNPEVQACIKVPLLLVQATGGNVAKRAETVLGRLDEGAVCGKGIRSALGAGMRERVTRLGTLHG